MECLQLLPNQHEGWRGRRSWGGDIDNIVATAGGPADDEEPIAVGGGRHGAAVADVDGIRRGGAAHGNDPTETSALTAARREGIEARQIEGGAATVYRQRRNRCPREDSVHRDGSRTGEGEEEGPRVDIPLEGEGLAGAG